MIGSAASIPIAGVRRGGSIQASRQPVTKLSAIPQVGTAFVGLTAPVGRLVAYSPAEFIQSAIATKFANPVTVQGDLVHIAEKEMEEGEAYFERNKETLVHHYEGKYIAIWENRVLDSDSSFSSLAQRVYEKLGYVSIYMPLVTSKRRMLRLESPITEYR